MAVWLSTKRVSMRSPRSPIAASTRGSLGEQTTRRMSRPSGREPSFSTASTMTKSASRFMLYTPPVNKITRDPSPVFGDGPAGGRPSSKFTV